jgi:hypothetical protein
MALVNAGQVVITGSASELSASARSLWSGSRAR